MSLAVPWPLQGPYCGRATVRPGPSTPSLPLRAVRRSSGAGLRRGEARRLKVEDVDLPRSLLPGAWDAARDAHHVRHASRGKCRPGCFFRAWWRIPFRYRRTGTESR
jgi:integrase